MFKRLVLMAAFFSCFSAWAEILVHLQPVALDQHILKVEIETPTISTGQHQLTMPIWRTGRYQQLDFASALAELQVVDSTGVALSLQQNQDQSWQFELKNPQSIRISYLLTADELTLRTRHLDQSHLFVDFASVVLQLSDSESQPYHIHFKGFPNSWKLRSGLAAGESSYQLTADNYQQLIDSPVEYGIHDHLHFSSHDADFELVVWGGTPADLGKMVLDIEALVDAAYDLWGAFPFQRYVFMLHATDNVRGGTEHINSTIMQWDRFKLNDDENYLNYMGLVAHEFVHSWNVKAYRPDAYVPYDLTQRAISPLLWLAEGSTSYLQEKLLLKAGMIDQAGYLKRLAKRLVRFQQKPGGKSQSVAEASRTQWIQLWNNHQHNFFANIYDEGFLVSWLMDLWLLEHSKQQVGIGFLHRYLYENHSLPNGLTEKQVILAMGQLTGSPLKAIRWWRQHVRDELEVEPETVLAPLGLSFMTEEEKLGFEAHYKAQSNGLLLSTVNRNGVGWKAGLAPADRIIAIDGFSVDESNIERMMHSWKTGQSLKLDLFRQGKLIQRHVKISSELKSARIELSDKASDAALKLRQAWFENR